MLHIGTKQEELAYRANPAINQSTLKQLQKGLQNFKALQDKETDASYFRIGSAVDCVLLGAEDAFEKEFYVSTIETPPTDTEKEILLTLYQMVEEDEELLFYQEALAFAIEEVGWQPRWKMETKVQKITENPACQEYFKELFLSQDKTLLSTTEFEIIMSVVESLRKAPNTRDFFDRVALQEDKNKVMYYQKPLYFTYKGEECKALLDMLLIECDEDKNVKSINIIDLKTMWGETLDFPLQALKHRYDIQITWYQKAVLESKDWLPQGWKINKDTLYASHFVVESTTNAGCPLVYETTLNFTKTGILGSKPITIEGREVLPPSKGYIELMDEYIYYKNTEFQEDIRLKDTEGVLKLH